MNRLSQRKAVVRQWYLRSDAGQLPFFSSELHADLPVYVITEVKHILLRFKLQLFHF